MAYYAKKSGLDSYRYARTKKDTICFLCHENIAKGEFRYAQRLISLCLKCANCWEREGGRLIDISRAKGKTTFF